MEKEAWKRAETWDSRDFVCLWIIHSRWRVWAGAAEGLNLNHVSVPCAPRKGPPLSFQGGDRELPPTNTSFSGECILYYP